MKHALFLVTLLTFFLTLTVSAQSTKIPYTYKNGLYKTFEDLIDGRAVTKIPYREEVHSNKEAVTRYNVMHEGKYKPIKGIYCYVNSNHIYLNAKEYGRKGYYIRSHFIGRYAYFEDRLGKEKFEMTRGAPGMTSATGAAVTAKIWGILLDMETGQVVKTSRWRMKKLLAPYPKLWKKYKEGMKTNQEVIEIVEELNRLAI